MLCGCGINVGTASWILENTTGDVWKCLLKFEDLIGAVIPYGTDGKFRCSRLHLLESIERVKLEEIVERQVKEQEKGQ